MTDDPDTPAADDPTVTSVELQADLVVSKSDSADPVVAGTNLTYTVTVMNAGPAAAQDVVVTDTLPAGVTLVSTAGCAEDPSGVPTCALGTVAAGASRQYSIDVSVDMSTSGTITNTAGVASSTTDPAGSDDSASEDTEATPPEFDYGDAPDPTYPTLEVTGTALEEGAALRRQVNDGRLLVTLIDFDASSLLPDVSFDADLLPGPLAAVPNFGDSPAAELAVTGRDGTDLVPEIRDASSGALVGGFTIGSPPAVPVPFNLVVQPDFGGGPAPELSVLFEYLGGPAQVHAFDADEVLALSTFVVP